MIYSSTLSAVVSALAAECIDNTSKQAWQKLYNPSDEEGAGIESLGRVAGGEAIDRNLVDCLVHAILHSKLKDRHWYALVARYGTHKGRKVEAISKLRPLIATPAPQLFLFKAVTAWAIPKLKGVQVTLSPSVNVEIPFDASPSKQAAAVVAALEAERVKRKRLQARSADMIVLPAGFYDMNTWDVDGRPEPTRREWRRKIHAVLDDMAKEALEEVEKILMAEGVLICGKAA